MRHVSRLLIASLAFVVVTAPSAPLAAQSETERPPGPLPGVFSGTIEVRVVNLEVVVTDQDGNPVRGLGPDDFRLLVDGEERPIEYFTEIIGGQAAVLPSEEDVASVPAVTPGEPIGSSYLLFIDDYFSIARDRNRVLRSLRDDLSFLGPQDRMAIVAWDGRQLEMLSTWSQSPAELRRALQRAQTRNADGLNRLMERRNVEFDQLVSFVSTAPTTVFENQLSPVEQQYVSRLSVQLGRSVSAAAAALRGFADPPGRKMMLLLAGGWPYLPAFYAVGDFSLRAFYAVSDEGDAIYRPLVDSANRLGYTIYPVDVPGFTSTAGGEVTSRTPVQNQVTTNRGLLQEREVEDALTYIAASTGGEAYVNAQREHALQLAFEDSRSYYWLGFSPDQEGDDRRHDVEIRTVDPRYRVRSRTDYLDSSRSHETTMAVESALLFGNPPGSGRLPLQLGTPRREGRRLHVSVEAMIPIRALTVLPQGDEWVAEAEVRIAVVDEDGDRAPIPVIPMRYTFSSEPDPTKYVSFERELVIRNKRHAVLVGVSDPVSGAILTGSGEVGPRH